MEYNMALVRRFAEEVQSNHNLEALDQIFEINVVSHIQGQGVSGSREELKNFLSMMLAAFPDIQATIHDQFGERDKMVTRKSFQGTHKGEFMDIPPTGKRIAFDAIEIVRIVSGRIKEQWCAWDRLGLLRQLGVPPIVDRG